MDVIINIENACLKTDRLILRPWKKEDLNDFYEYASMPGVGEMAGWKHHQSISMSEVILNYFIAKKEVFAIEYKENNKVIGSIGLHLSWANQDFRYQNLKVKEVGYVLSKDYWGQGIMVEALTAMMTYCFDELKLEALSTAHFTMNAQSQRVIEKCGFEFVKDSEYYVSALEETYQDKKYILINKK